jgi:signal transduction histidine kinase
MLVVSAAIGFGLSRLALRPLRSIQSTANRIRSDNLTERIPVANVKDEISNLARLLNQMFDRLESAFNQIRRFSADASHELKTPLSLMRLHAEKMLMEGGLSQSQQEAVAAQLEELDRLNEIVEDLLFLSRAEARAITLHPQLQAPTPFLLSFEQDARVLAEHEGVQCTLIHRGEGAVSFDPKWIRQVLLNLVKNSLNVSPSGSHISILSDLSEAGWTVSVEDQGPGVSPDQREHIFERFVRVGNSKHPDERGTGLGLAICRSIVDLHGGRIFASPASRSSGLCVTFVICADDRPLQAPAEAKPFTLPQLQGEASS